MTELRLLGPVELWVAGRLQGLGPARQRTVLAALAVDVNRPVPVDVLIDRVWGDNPPGGARSGVYSYVTRLRNVLSETDGGGSVRLESSSDGYVVRADPNLIDLHRMQSLVDEARNGASADERRTALLSEAVRLWRGEPLAGLGGAWAERVRQRLRRQRVDAVVQWAQLELRLGRPGLVIESLREMLAEQPLVEPLAAQLMRALHRERRSAEALDWYATVRRHLVEELGTEPGLELRQLYQAILHDEGDESADSVAAPQVLEARHEVVPSQLPGEAFGFTGRVAEVARLDRLLSDGQSDRAVVISAIAGTAGVGKTALAVHWAHRVRDKFADGQLYVNLRGYASAAPVRPIDALAGFLRALGIPAEKVPTEVDEASALYRSVLTDKRMLVVLDNAGGAEQVRPLLPGAPGCLAVVTSRDALAGLVARDGARRLTLDMLTADEAVALLTRLLGAGRVTAEPGAAAELARRCAYLPLALRIAAANLPDRDSIAGYVARLAAGNRLAALEVDGDEQAAVRAAFDLSYAAHSEPAQRLFRLLGLVPGPDVTAEAAAALADTTIDQAQRLLDRLAAAHLIAHHAGGRYAFHDLLRDYARQRAADHDTVTERTNAAARLYRWYRHNTDDAARLLYPQLLRLTPALSEATRFADHTAARAWLQAELPCLVAAILANDGSAIAEASWLLADSLRGYFWQSRNTVDWLRVATAGLAAAEAQGDLRAQTAMQLSLGHAYMCLSDYERATEHTSSAVSLAEQTGWLACQAGALGNLGMIYGACGQLATAAVHHREAARVYRMAGSRVGEAIATSNQGQADIEGGSLRSAVENLSKALALHRENQSHSSEAFTQVALAEAYHLLGDVGRSFECASNALTYSRQVGNLDSEVLALDRIAALRRDAGEFSQALEAAETAQALAQESGDSYLEVIILSTLSTIHDSAGSHDKAIEYGSAALTLAGEVGNRGLEVEILVGLARAKLNCHHHGAARDHAGEALRRAEQNGYRLRVGLALTVLADVELHENDRRRAAQLAESALKVHRETGYRLGEARAMRILERAVGSET